MMNIKRDYFVTSLGLTLALLVGFQASADEGSATASPVVMVCKDGAVRSVIAAQLFDQAARERGLPFRAISRGLTPHEHIPANVAEALAKDGFDVSGFNPRGLSGRDFANSLRVVAIGTDLSAFQSDAASPILQWNDIPSGSDEYEHSKASLLTHIHALLDELQQ